LPSIFPSLWGERDGGDFSTECEELVAQPCNVRLFLSRDAEQPLTELRVMHALGVLGELGDILGFFELGVAKYVEELLTVISV
jgi:hypothetical protein